MPKDERDLSGWADWTDGELIEQAAAASQCRMLLDDEIVREAIAMNIIAPFRQALDKERNTIANNIK